MPRDESREKCRCNTIFIQYTKLSESGGAQDDSSVLEYSTSTIRRDKLGGPGVSVSNPSAAVARDIMPFII